MFNKLIIIPFVLTPTAFISGYFLAKKRLKNNIIKPYGILYLDKSDVFDNYNLFLEIEKNVDKIANDQLVTFKVIKKNFLPDAK